MIGFGFRLPVVCLVGMGLVGCSAAGDGGVSAGNSDPPLMLNPGPQQPGGAMSGTAGRPGGSDLPTPGLPIPSDDGDEPGDDDDTPNGNCDCAIDVPGIIIDHDDGGIAVIVDLPNIGMVVIDTQHGDVTTSATGVDIKGDVTVDLGGISALPLADANLHVAIPAVGLPTIQGNANILGSLLEGTGCGCEGSLLPVGVALDVDAAALLPSSDALAALSLNLELPQVTLDMSGLPLAADALALVQADVHILTDGGSKLLELDAKVGAGADVWTSAVPLATNGLLRAKATVLDGSLASVAITGDVGLQGGGLLCSLTPLVSVDLPDAVVTLDTTGASLSATANASLHPGFSLTGEARVTGRFDLHDWSINVCGAVMTSLFGGSTGPSDCLDIGKNGVTPCRLPTN